MISLALAALIWAPAAGAAGTASPRDLALVNRVTWGETASAAADVARLGLDRWLDGSVHLISAP